MARLHSSISNVPVEIYEFTNAMGLRHKNLDHRLFRRLPFCHKLMFNLVSFVFLQIRLVNISSNDIVDGNPKLILGLVWSIILHWQVS